MRTNGRGPRISKKAREEAKEEAKQERRRQQDENTARSLASSAANSNDIAAPGYWDMLGNPDLDHPQWGDNLEAFVSGGLSRAFSLGNITESEYQDMMLRIENEFWMVQNEMRDQDTTLSDDDMRLFYGEERADLSDSKARRLREAREVKKMLISLSKDAKALDAGTQIHAVAKTEDEKEDAEDSGGLRGWLGR